jgi:hypothetical protein
MKLEDLRITESIQKAFKEACQRKGIEPNLPIVGGLDPAHQKAVISFYMLAILISDLNGDWKPDFTDWRQPKYIIWWDVEEKTVGGIAYSGLHAGLVYSISYNAAFDASTFIGSRLCFKSRELARKAANEYKPLFENVLLLA